MSQLELPRAQSPVVELDHAARPARRWERMERWLAAASERLNPILVKEARQALKSRQFALTFALVLVCAWIWSIFGVAIIGPSIYYSEHGRDLFAGYFLILLFPLLVIVPYGAFRSLAAEREDRTYELLCITSLKPRQIVTGKLASAVVQMLVYFSAVAPCLAFTYMLRGIDVLTILFLIVYVFLASLAFSLAALLLATLTTERHWQVVMSVVLVAALGGGFWLACIISFMLLSSSNFGFQDRSFWIGHAAGLTAYVSYFLLVLQAAASRLTFESDNRSTALRWIAFIQQVLLVGWMAGLWFEFESGDIWVFAPFFTVSLAHWYVMGAFMTGESADLSPRVRRRLPQTLLGRVFLTWFNPGPGTGYMFALANLGGVAVLVALTIAMAEVVFPQVTSKWKPIEVLQILTFMSLGVAYLAIYLGIGKLIVALLRRFDSPAARASALVHVLLLLAGVGVPWTIQLMSPTLRTSGYSLLHISNPLWTLAEVTGSSQPVEVPLLLLLLPAMAVVVLVLNARSIFAEVSLVRVAPPSRVAEDDALRAPAPAPASPTSPWDDRRPGG